MESVRVAGSESGPMPVVLVDVGHETDVVPIFIGFEEALSIARGVDAMDVGRPLTHDLFLDVVEELGGRVRRAVVTREESGTFFADLHLDTPREATVVDSRPSDALALVSRTDAPIEVAVEVFESARRPREEFDDFDDIREVAL
ncbi:hypothetical protein GCM10009039_28760 [Halocalculus aciditolerans]|uniref:BFN domain-containing protein n=2 Tax=Halocalculus aciditolerans TaxID=1383812 RepID=A0A830FN14_9EURY|nr:hypothetical protein GCM10009039_28760 [Halocalculus aciditolerans]